MARVSLTQLVKHFPQPRGEPVPVVKGVSLEIADGEFMVLVGPSGCGKSTTLRMIAGLEEVSDGSIKIDDVEVASVPPKDRDIAMVFQNYALYPHMSVFENMAFGIKMRGADRATIESRVHEAAAMLGLEPYLRRRPKDLSGGQRQRVAVGRAIVRQPKVFLFDEPLSNLDAKMRVSTRNEIMRLHAQLRATMIYVTHDQVEAMTMGDRICVMKDGEIMQVDTPMNVYRQPANLFVAGFIGSPPMNLIPGKLIETPEGFAFASNDGAFTTVIRHTLVGASVGDAVTMGVRPEDVTLREGPPGSPQIERVEHMGAEALVYFKLGETACIARLDGDCALKFGDSVFPLFTSEKAHFFDSLTGRRL